MTDDGDKANDRADDGSDTKRHQGHGSQRSLERMFPLVTLFNQPFQRLCCQKAHAITSRYDLQSNFRGYGLGPTRVKVNQKIA